VATTLRTSLALDALEMARWTRGGDRLEGLVHHSDSEYVEAGCSWVS
jgi:transposase InsO family protein